MKVRLYLDEDSMDRAVVRGLRVHGVDVQTASDASMVDRLDPEHLAYAASQGRVLCSFNIRDFGRLHAEWQRQGRHHAGIALVAQQRYSVGELVRRMLMLAATETAESMCDRVVFLSAFGRN